MSALIRQIQLNDAEAFHRCLDSVAHERKYLAQVEALPIDRIAAFVAESVKNDAAQFVALVEGELVGWCDVFPGWPYATQHVGTLGMGVHIDSRGRGIGEQLLRKTLEHSLQKGIFRVSLQARADNLKAIRLYERVGFVHEGIARAGLRFDGIYYDAVRMALLQGPAQQSE